MTEYAPPHPLIPSRGIPAARRPPPLHSQSEPDDEEHLGADKRGAARLLVVEDEWFVATDLEATLREAGHQVLGIVVSAGDAVQFAGDEQPDLIIMDVRLLGGRDGVDAALEIRRRFNIPCLFVSAHADEALKARAEPARPAGWLTKPVSGDVVVAAVNAALKNL